MTEQQWEGGDDPAAMLRWLLGGEWFARGVTEYGRHKVASDRKLRLFAAACCRLDPDRGSKKREAVFAAEKIADGKLPPMDDPTGPAFTGWTVGERELVLRNASEVAGRWAIYMRRGAAVAWLLREVVGNPFRPVTLCQCCWRPLPPGDDNLCRGCGLTVCLACVEQYGHFLGEGHRRPDSDALSLAQGAYEERLPDGTLDPARLAVLSDALEEAGCPSWEKCPWCEDSSGSVRMYCDRCVGSGRAGRLPHPLLAHLRSPGPHYRGCWAVDLVLGTE